MSIGTSIELKTSPIHGTGAFAARRLRKGFQLGTYEGRRYSPAAAARKNWNQALTYVFVLSDGTYIDGRQGGSPVRHLNHCCAPNCEAVEVEAEDGSLSIVIETVRGVRAGEELFIDYTLDVGEGADPAEFACHCGAATCRGTMLAP